MKEHLDHNAATYSPMTFKSFDGALYAFFAQECPQLGGGRTRQVLVATILGMVDQFYPNTTNLRPGQMPWTTVHKDEKASYGKKIIDTRMTSVVLDLVRPEDVRERVQGKKLREIKKDAVARLFQQAFEQEGCLTNAELAILLKIAPTTVSKYTREWEQEHDRQLPRRGTIHDLGPTLTHKKQIIEKLFLEGKSVEQVCRETDHSPQAVQRYIQAFKQVFVCKRKQLSEEDTAYATKMSVNLVKEYIEIIDKMAEDNRAVFELLDLEKLAKEE